MNKNVLFSNSRSCWLAGVIALFASQSLRAGITFTNTPAAVGNAYSGLITLQIGGLNSGETVVVQKFLDLNSNGVVDATDYLMGQFNLTDGQAGMVIGGVTNPIVPGDNNPTVGQITAKINLALSGFEQTIIGRYAYVVSSPTARFTPVTNWFSVTNVSYGQTISGNVRNSGTNIPYAIALLLVATGDGNITPQTGIVTDGSGHFAVSASPGGYALVGLKTGFAANTSVAPYVMLNSGGNVTTNVIVSPATQTISGTLVDTNNPSIHLPGILVSGQSSSGLLAVTFADTNGSFTLGSTPDTWKINSQSSDLAFHGYVTPNSSPRVNSTGGSLSGVILGYAKATAMFYGKVTDAAGNPLSGIDVFAGDDNSNYGVDVDSDANGNYFCGVVGGLGANDPWFIDPSNDSNPVDLIYSQPAFLQNGGTNLTVGQAAVANFTAIVATNQISGTVKDSRGNPISGVGVSAYATINGADFNLDSVDTDTNGNYTLVAANGDWSVFVFCNGGNDSLDNILGSGNYECPNNVSTVVNNDTATANFVVQPGGSYQIFGYVRDTTGNPITGINVYANGTSSLTTTTDNDGYYSFNVGNGNWNLNVDCAELAGRGYSCPAYQQVNVANGSTSLPDFIVSQCEPLAITTGDTLNDADATFNYSYSLQNVGCDAPFTWSLTPGSLGLPEGLTLDPAGVISGIPSTSAIGTNYFSVRVTDGVGNTADQLVSLAVYPAPQITNSSLPNATLGTFYSVQLGSTGGDGALFGWIILSGSLPPGLTLYLGGAITGTPTQTGTYTFTVGGVDNAGAQPQKTLSITVISPLQVTTSTLPPGYTGVSYSSQLEASGGKTPYTWSIAPGSQAPPSPLVLSPDGLLSGIPAASGTYSFIVKVTDANSSSATRSLSLTIEARPALSLPHRMANGSFVFTVNGAANQNYTVQYSSTLTNWSTLVTTNSATASFQIADPLNFNLRYYRVLVGP